MSMLYYNDENEELFSYIGKEVFIRTLSGLNVRGKLVNVTDKYLSVLTDKSSKHPTLVMMDYVITVEKSVL